MGAVNFWNVLCVRHEESVVMRRMEPLLLALNSCHDRPPVLDSVVADS